MFFSKLEIKNFRSIGSDGVVIDFEDNRNSYALIGANNSGKSNIIDALALVLGIRSGKFYNYEITSEDFHKNNIENDITIKLYLSNPVEHKDAWKRKSSIEGFVLKVHPYKVGVKKGSCNIEHHCFGKDHNGSYEEPLLDKQPNKSLPLQPKRVVDQFGDIFFLDIQNLDKFFSKISGYGVLGRLFQIYRDNFSSDNSKYKYTDPADGKQKEMVSKVAYQRTAERLSDILRTDKLKEIENTLSKNIDKFLGLDGANQSISLGIPNHEELLSQLITLKIQEYEGSDPRKISDLGSGYLSLLRLAAIVTLSEMSDNPIGMFLIEEPEIYLHPHLRRFYYTMLNDLSSKGSSVVYSTHSEEFVSLEDYLSVIRIEKIHSGETTSHQVPKHTNLDFDKMYTKVKARGNDDVLFAQHVLLTEGQDDQIAFQELLIKANINCNARSISVVDCGSKTQLPDYIKLCSSLGIRYYVIYDTDTENASSDSDTKKILKALDSDPNKYSAMPNSLETSLNLTKKSNQNWRQILELLESLSYEAIKSQFPDFSDALQPFIDQIQGCNAEDKSEAA